MSLGPFDLTGGPFLTLYATLLILAVIAGVLIARWQRPEGRPGRIDDPDALALLAGGPQRFYDAIVARLLSAGALHVTNRSLLAAGGATTAREPDRRLLALATRAPASWQGVETLLQPHAAAAERALVDAGLMIERGTTWPLRLWQVSPYLVLILFGVIKREIGAARDRPVGYLTALLIVTAVLALIRFAVVDRRTRAGIALIAEERARRDRLRRAPTRDETDLAVALFGTGVLIGSAWSAYRGMRSASAGAGGGDGGSGGGDGGCGGGGGGGGGCGGCGS